MFKTDVILSVSWMEYIRYLYHKNLLHLSQVRFWFCLWYTRVIHVWPNVYGTHLVFSFQKHCSANTCLLVKLHTHWDNAFVKHSLFIFVSVGMIDWCNDCGWDCLLLHGYRVLCYHSYTHFWQCFVLVWSVIEVIGIYHWFWAFIFCAKNFITCSCFALDYILQYSKVHVCM
jgi:hypothetical protein